MRGSMNFYRGGGGGGGGGGGPGPSVRKQLFIFNPQHCNFPGDLDLLPPPPLDPHMKAKTDQFSFPK